MTTRPKGFDPLSSLFEQSDTDPADDAAPEAPGSSPPQFAPVLEPTDSFFSAPAGGPRAPVARVATPAPKATPPPVDPVALARILAKSAAARAGPPRAAPRPAAPPPTEATGAVPSGRPATRIEGLARRPGQARTAEEVLADMARTPVRPAPSPAPSGFPVQEIHGLIAQKMRGIGEFRVANCIAVEQRDVLRALWKAHRTRFAAEGRLDHAVGAASVLEALDRIPEGRLAVAHVFTRSSDFLLWLDTGERRLIAAFTDARAFLAGR